MLHAPDPRQEPTGTTICLLLSDDAALPPISFEGLTRGDVMLVQTRAGRVPTPDAPAWRIEALRHAVEDVGVRDLVVCGRRASARPSWAPPDLISPEDHVAQQIEHALAWDFVRRAVDAGRLRVHGWVHDEARGEVREIRGEELALAAK